MFRGRPHSIDDERPPATDRDGGRLMARKKTRPGMSQATQAIPAAPATTQATGMFFFGTAWSEPTLIKYAYAFEQRTKGRVTPQFLPTFPKTK